MSAWKRLARRAWFGLRGLDPEAVVVTFRTGDEAAVHAMCEDVLRILPDRRHYFVSVGPCQAPPWMTPVVLDSRRGLWRQLRRAFRRLRIGMAPVLFTRDPEFARLRRAAFALAPRKVLAYNERLERHHLRAGCPLASFLFWRGLPLDRIWLRPWWLWPWRRERTVRPATTRVVDGRPFSSARARIAILSPYLPWPLSHGGAVRIFHMLREGAMSHDIMLLAFVEGDRPPPLGPLRNLCAQIILVEKPRYREPRWSTLDPPEVGEYWSPAMERAVNRARREFQVAAVQAEYTQMAQYGAEILVEHDITCDLYRQVYERDRSRGRWWDWWRWRRFETRMLAAARRVVVMSPKDAALSGRKDAVVLANGVDLARFMPSPEPAGRHLLFIGSFRHFPNALAYRFLIDEVWPPLTRRFHELTMTVVAGPEALLHWQRVTGQRAIPAPRGVRLLEFVAEVKPLYDEANVVLVPTPVSAGTNVKVLEAMAMQRAVVSTTSGCAGLGLVPGVSVSVADSASDFIEAASSLLTDGSQRASQAQAARRHAERHFSWKRIGAAQRALWDEVAPPPLAIRDATKADLDAIAAIQAASPEASQWPPPDYLKHRCLVAELEARPVAFLVWRQTAPGENEILNLAVHPEWRWKGVASRMLSKLTDNSTAEWFLEVRESNAAAIRLYEKHGFQVVGKRAQYYASSLEAGIVLRLRSC